MDSRVESLIKLLREKGYKLTPQRVAIFNLLCRTRAHPSAEAIYQEVRREYPMIGLATVYKTLAVLKEMGLVLELGFGDESHRYDGNPKPHSHIICLKCRRIDDLEESFLLDSEKIITKSNYQIIGHRLEFYGYCPKCREKR